MGIVGTGGAERKFEITINTLTCKTMRSSLHMHMHVHYWAVL